MKKQGSDQQFHDRRYQERKRAEAARKTANGPAVRDGATQPAEGKGPGDGQKKVIRPGGPSSESDQRPERR
jgi:hypothetical protein